MDDHVGTQIAARSVAYATELAGVAVEAMQELLRDGRDEI